MIEEIKRKENEIAVLVGIITGDQDEAKALEYLDELAFLATTAGAEPIHQFTQKLEYPNIKTFVGSGKLIEISNYIKENEVDLVIFDDDLKTLFLITLLGGGIGSYIGMKKFRHKTQKLGFIIGIPFITILEIVLIIYTLFKG